MILYCPIHRVEFSNREDTCPLCRRETNDPPAPKVHAP